MSRELKVKKNVLPYKENEGFTTRTGNFEIREKVDVLLDISK